MQKSACILLAGFCSPPLPYICVLFSGRYSFIIADFLFNDKRRRAGNHIAGFFIAFVRTSCVRPLVDDCMVALKVFHIPLYVDTASF